jgi:signal transduction histidine kinase
MSFITVIVYRYQQKQNAYFKNLEELKGAHENAMLQSQLEIQEQTFQNISREIHDNIGQKLTLVKLQLNTMQIPNNEKIMLQVNDSVKMIGEVINDLSDISRSMSSEIILNSGFIKALEFEVSQLNKPGLYNIRLLVTGETVFLDAHKELVLFRITQEALNNIVKHANASDICIQLHYNKNTLCLDISDNGRGFQNEGNNKPGAGFINMTRRANMLSGKCIIHSEPGKGTAIKIEIPLYEQSKEI